MVIGIFFPRDSGDNSNFYEMRDAQANDCNFEAVKHHLNKYLEEDKKYQKIVHLPLSGLSVSAPSLGKTVKPMARAYEEAEKQATVFEYVDRSFIVEFDLTEKELDEVNLDFQRGTGLPLMVSFNFDSRQNDGEVIVNLDAASIKAKFEAQAAGKPKFLGSLEVKAMLQASIDSSNMRVEVKGGITERSEDVLDKVVNKVIDGLSFDQKAADIPAGEFTETKGDSDYISLEVVAQAIYSSLSQSFRYSRTTSALKTTVDIPVNVSHHAIDPYIKGFFIKDGFNSVRYPKLLKKGDTVLISPGYAYMGVRNWGEKRQYVTLGQMMDLGFTAIFPFLHDSFYSFKNVQGDLGSFAIGTTCHWYSLQRVFGDYYCSYSRFLRIQRFPTDEIRGNRKQYAPKTKAQFAQMPMYVSFSRIDGGQKIFTLSGLLNASEQEIAPFEARIKGESIELTALEDLGLMRMGERFKKYDLAKEDRDPYNNNNVVKIYSTLPENPIEECPSLEYGGDTNSCHLFKNETDLDGNGKPDVVLLYREDWKLPDGSHTFSYRSDIVITDEALIDHGWGAHRMDERADKEVDGGQNGMPINNRIDYHAIRSYRGFFATVSWPYQVEEDGNEIAERARGVISSQSEED